jgi:hypothetical protein
MKKVLITLLIFAIATAQIWASPDPNPTHIESIKRKVADCINHQRRVVVETYDNRQMLGFISEANADDFVLSYGGKPTTLDYREVKKIKWPSPIRQQIEVFAGAAAIAGALYGLVALFGGLRG